MYVMCAGLALDNAGRLVWHVMAKNDTITLCGQPAPADDGGGEAGRNCATCMARVREKMQVRSA
ncbi:hypothetical protein ABZ128_10710 [Streptomyces sp. NPDC006326]|uniref:hypothetical protein n=1 Tax=Streptomyces sp. NPDC006326 TaxID=3156752 RepID=UPI0033BC6569